MRAPALRLYQDELIVDSFAGGGGASLGIEHGLGRSPDVAINHDREAIALHQANHPATKHYCEDVWKVDPRKACRSRPGLLWASPDCKHFSKAKGGKPVDKKIRGLAWVVVRWAKAVRPRVIILENVEEFEDWGPLLPNGKPCPERTGFTFRIWVGKLKALGYSVEWRELAACDYGAPTTRNRLFLVARCDGQPIVWPTPTHGRGLTPHRTAAECITWSLPTYSIFLTRDQAKRYGVKRPLAENTMRRIARGMRKFVIENPEPFIVPVMHGAEPRVWGIDEPMRTITGANRGDRALVTPYIARIGQTGGNGRYCQHARAPLSTITSKAEHLLLAPFFTSRYGEREGQAPRAISIERPMPTIVPTQNGAQLVAAFMAKHYGGHETPGSKLAQPIDTVTARDHNALVVSHLSNFYTSNTNGGQGDLFRPMPAVMAQGNHQAEIRAFMVKYYGSNDAVALDVPMRTVTGADRFGLVTVHGEPYVIADIGMRMLAPRELYRAQGFPDEYLIDVEVDGRPLPKEAQVRMVGNSVCPPIAAAIARAQFEDRVIEVAA
jgi:DNA (cytosine-5)-methyltransferase 1